MRQKRKWTRLVGGLTLSDVFELQYYRFIDRYDAKRLDTAGENGPLVVFVAGGKELRLSGWDVNVEA